MDREQQRREPRTPILDVRVGRPIAWISREGLFLWSRFSHREEFRSWSELWEIMEALQQPPPDEESAAMAILRMPQD